MKIEQAIETFKDINEYEGYYQISNLGRVKSLKLKKPTILEPTDSGYILHKDGIKTTIPFDQLDNYSTVKVKTTLIGAYYSKMYKRWRSIININGKNKYLGTFKTELEAHQCYLEALNKKQSV